MKYKKIIREYLISQGWTSNTTTMLVIKKEKKLLSLYDNPKIGQYHKILRKNNIIVNA